MHLFFLHSLHAAAISDAPRRIFLRLNALIYNNKAKAKKVISNEIVKNHFFLVAGDIIQ